MAANSLSINIKQFVEKTGIKADLVVKSVAFDMLAGVVDKSPVDTGFFRANWRVSLNQPDLSVEEQGIVAPRDEPKVGSRVNLYSIRRIFDAKTGQFRNESVAEAKARTRIEIDAHNAVRDREIAAGRADIGPYLPAAGKREKKRQGLLSASEAAVKARGEATILGSQLGDTIFITNNTEYGESLENGHSGQAPNGMVKITFAEVSEALATKVKSV